MWPVSTPPGWYDDGSGTQRWWNGTTWGEQSPPPAFPAGGLPGQPGFPGGQPGQPGQPTPGPRRTGLVIALVVALVAVVALVVVVLVLALGGDDDRDDSSDRDGDRDRDARPSATVTSPTFDLPTDASEDDFCAAMQVAGEEIVDQSSQEGDETVDFGVAIEVLKATGTPADIPDDARTGFEAIIEAMEDANGLTVDEFEEQDEAELDGEEAFGDYYTETCASF